MKRNFKLYFLAAIAVVGFGIGIARAQEQLPAPSPIEKEIAARASDVSEVTLDKAMLGFAGQFMDKGDSSKKLIDGLDGIYIRNYEFAKEGAYTKDEIDQLRAYFTNGGEWHSLVKERSQKDGESSDIMMKMVNGQQHGMFILTAEPKEISIVFILGPIQMDDLKHLNGLGAQLGSVPNAAEIAEMKSNAEQVKVAEKSRKAAEKQKKEAEKNRQAIEKGNQQEEK